MDVFARMEGKSEPQEVRFRFVLALILMRKRLLKYEGSEVVQLPADAKPDAKPNYILYNPKTGRIEESSVSVKLKGTLTVTIGGTDTTVELYQEQTTTVKTGDKTFLPEPGKK